MTQHKWHKEIKAWADGAEIESKYDDMEWITDSNPDWMIHLHYEYRIKPQPVKPQYLYAWFEPNYGKTYITANLSIHGIPVGYEYIGKIPLIVESNDD